MAYLPCYAIFGIGGILGNSLYFKLSRITPSHRIFAFDKQRLDVTVRSHVAQVLSYVKPTIVFNCAGMNDPLDCERAKQSSRSINTIGAKILAEECHNRGIKFVQFSTCYVYGGKTSTPYIEGAKTKPLNEYGKSKAAADKIVAQTMDNYLIIRPGFIFGEDGQNSVIEWINKAESNQAALIPSNIIVSPTYAGDLMDSVIELVNSESTGEFNITNEGNCSLGELAAETLKLAKLKAHVKSIDDKRIALPNNVSLSTAKHEKVSGKKMRPWRTAMMECLFNMHKYRP